MIASGGSLGMSAVEAFLKKIEGRRIFFGNFFAVFAKKRNERKNGGDGLCQCALKSKIRIVRCSGKV